MKKVVFEPMIPNSNEFLEDLNNWFRQYVALAFNAPAEFFDTSMTGHSATIKAVLSDVTLNRDDEVGRSRLYYAWFWYTMALKARARLEMMQCQRFYLKRTLRLEARNETT